MRPTFPLAAAARPRPDEVVGLGPRGGARGRSARPVAGAARDYAHVPALPADDLAAGRLLALTAIAAALAAVGLVAYRRRDAA
jgi:hypothetical protein